MRLIRLMSVLLVATGGAVLFAAPVPAGEIRLGDVPATAVATVSHPAKYEKQAAGELVSYLEKISGKKLAKVEIADKVVPEGTIAVGSRSPRSTP
jgi:hypothetical protein